MVRKRKAIKEKRQEEHNIFLAQEWREELERKIKKIKDTHQYSSFFYAFAMILLTAGVSFFLVLGGLFFASLTGSGLMAGAYFGSLPIMIISMVVFDDINRYSQKNRWAMEDRIKELKESMTEV